MNSQYLVGSNIFKQKNYYAEKSRFYNLEKLFYSIRIRISAIVAPWQMAVAGFWISAMANFMKDGGATVPYSDMAAPYIGRYVSFLSLCHGLPLIYNKAKKQNLALNYDFWKP